MATTSTDLTYDFRVGSIGVTGDDRINVTLIQMNDGVSNVVTANGSTTLVVDKETARTIFPGDVYTMTLVKKA